MSEETLERQGGSFAELVRAILTEDDEGAREYLRESWLSAAMSTLRKARRQAGLTQDDIARLLHTSQPAIARLERDSDGRTTLHRFIDYALACGLMPLDLVVEPFEMVRNYSVANPEESREQVAFEGWLHGLASGNAPRGQSAAVQSTAEAVAEATVWGDCNMTFDQYSQALLDWREPGVTREVGIPSGNTRATGATSAAAPAKGWAA